MLEKRLMASAQGQRNPHYPTGMDTVIAIRWSKIGYFTSAMGSFHSNQRCQIQRLAS
jgi:hypothetical protein